LFLSLKRFNLPLLFLASSIPGLRTSSGKDTLIYLQRHNYIHNNTVDFDYEPFFTILIDISTVVEDSRISWWLFNFIYGLFLLSLSRYISKKVVSHKNVAISLLIIFAIDAAFNGMRSGLMYVFILASFMSANKFSSFLSGVLGVLTHISGLIIAGLSWLRKRPVVFGLLFSIFFFFTYDYILDIIAYNERLNSKFVRYSESKNISKYSGLVDLVVFALLYISYRGRWYYIILIPLVIFVHLFWLQNFYGVFRVYRLLLIFILSLIWTQGIRWRAGYLMASVFLILNFLKQVVMTAGSEGGFIPFR